MFLSQARILGKARILGCPRTFFRALCQPHVKNGCSPVYRLGRTRVLFLTPLGDRRFSNPNPSGNGSPPSLNPLRIIWTGGERALDPKEAGPPGGTSSPPEKANVKTRTKNSSDLLSGSNGCESDLKPDRAKKALLLNDLGQVPH